MIPTRTPEAARLREGIRKALLISPHHTRDCAAMMSAGYSCTCWRGQLKSALFDTRNDSLPDPITEQPS